MSPGENSLQYPLVFCLHTTPVEFVIYLKHTVQRQLHITVGFYNCCNNVILLPKSYKIIRVIKDRHDVCFFFIVLKENVFYWTPSVIQYNNMVKPSGTCYTLFVVALIGQFCPIPPTHLPANIQRRTRSGNVINSWIYVLYTRPKVYPNVYVSRRFILICPICLTGSRCRRRDSCERYTLERPMGFSNSFA